VLDTIAMCERGSFHASSRLMDLELPQAPALPECVPERVCFVETRLHFLREGLCRMYCGPDGVAEVWSERDCGGCGDDCCAACDSMLRLKRVLDCFVFCEGILERRDGVDKGSHDWESICKEEDEQERGVKRLHLLLSHILRSISVK
jgi:hypothetical protein